MNVEKNEESWIISEGESENGKLSVIRLREDLPPDTVRAKLKNLVLITWNYEPVDESGMPSQEDTEKMERFEDLMDAGVVETGFGRLMTVFTGEGLKEWQFYTGDEEVFMQKLNETLAGEEVLPLEIEVFEDENWDGYQDYRNLIGE